MSPPSPPAPSSSRAASSARGSTGERRTGSNGFSPLEVIMPQSTQLLIAARHDHMFPTLNPAEIDRLRRFGEARSYPAGERIVTAGEVSPGLIVVLSGKVEVTQGGALDRRETIGTHRPGQFSRGPAQPSPPPPLVAPRGIDPV